MEQGIKGVSEEFEGEGFHIDLKWLAEALRLIKWSDDIAKTWLVTKFGIDTKGDLKNDVLPRCTREQAEEFVTELQNRSSKIQMNFGD